MVQLLAVIVIMLERELFHFNSTMVQLLVEIAVTGTGIHQYFNSTMVQLLVVEHSLYSAI